MRISIVAGCITFAGAATAAAIVTSSYPVAIWAVGFAAIYRATHPIKPHTCPLAEMAAAKEANVDVVRTPCENGW